MTYIILQGGYREYLQAINDEVMKKNMGIADRVIRAIIVLVIMTLILTGTVSGVIVLILSMLASVYLITSLSGNCPFYRVLGIRTCAE